MNGTHTMTLGVVSVNYNYIPTELESGKWLWLELTSSAPRSLERGGTIKLWNKYRKVNSEEGKFPLGIFKIVDIIGFRVVLDGGSNPESVVNTNRQLSQGKFAMHPSFGYNVNQVEIEYTVKCI